MEFGWHEDDVSFRDALRAFLDQALPVDWDERTRGGPGGDAQVAFARRFCPELAARGWLVQHWPAAWGGRDAEPWRHAILGEELWACGEPRGPQYMNVNWIGPAILRFGSDAQKREHLPRIARGEVFWCQGFSEPEAGSDLAALRTSASRRGETYLVDGSKIWTSYANHADFCFLLARTDPASRRQRGITVLLVPMDLPGIEVREVPSVVGDRYFHEVFFTEVAVPETCRLGAEGEGWNVVTWVLGQERVGAARYARASRVLDALAEEARRRERLGDVTVLEKLGSARAACEAARILAYRVIDQRAREHREAMAAGRPLEPGAPTPDTNVARIAGTWAERAVSDLALELLGPEALPYGSFADAHFRLAMTAGVAVGTTEINLNLVAGRALGLPRE